MADIDNWLAGARQIDTLDFGTGSRWTTGGQAEIDFNASALALQTSWAMSMYHGEIKGI